MGWPVHHCPAPGSTRDARPACTGVGAEGRWVLTESGEGDAVNMDVPSCGAGAMGARGRATASAEDVSAGAPESPARMIRAERLMVDGKSTFAE